MLDSTDRLMIEDILRVTAARLASPAGVGLRGAGKTSPAHLTLDVYRKWGGLYTARQLSARPGGYKWLRAAAVLADAGVDLEHDGQNPPWADLRARRCGNQGAFGSVAPARAAIVEDIVRVTAASGFLPPVRPSFRQYQEMGGRYPLSHAAQRGGWSALCAEAGFATGRRVSDRFQGKTARARLDVKALRSAVIDDIARVAAARRTTDSAAATSNGLSKHDYLHGGGRFTLTYLQKVWGRGKWDGLCKAAGVKPAPHPRGSRTWTRPGSEAARAAPAKADAGRMTLKELESALDRVTGRVLPPRPMARIMGYHPPGWRRHRNNTLSKTDAFDRDEIVADLRRVSRNAGVYLARLLWDDYRIFGGRFTLEEMRDFGGFGALARIAASGTRYRPGGAESPQQPTAAPTS